MTQGLRPLATPHVTAHDQAVRVFATRVVGKQAQRVGRARLEVAAFERSVGQAHQQPQADGSQPIAFKDRVGARAEAQVAAVQPHGPLGHLGSG